jgi:ABC-type transport system involved in multi-copper enzyme maturation permease subunit
MLGILIKKEITETILDLRFVIVTLLCMVLIPLGMYVSRKNYEQRVAEYQREYQMYRQHYGEKVSYNTQAQGHRPPSVLSIFALGLDPFLPDKVITSRTGLFDTAKAHGINNPQSLLFGKVDLLFNVSFVMSLAALIFTFNSISSEKEKGTLRLAIANSIPRGKVLLAKIAGNYIVILFPFLISLLFALLILDASPDVSIMSQQVWPSLLVIIFVTLLFLFAMVGLGICISTLTHTSLTSIVILLFVWVILVLAVPKVSPMIAEIIYPVESQSVLSLRKQIASKNVKEEYDQKRKELFDKCRTAFGIPLGGGISNQPSNNKEEKAYAQYEKELPLLNEECQKHTANVIRQIEQDYKNKRHIQASIAMNLSRISPVSCYTYLLSGLSKTGITEPENFDKNAQIYQDEVKKSIYDNYIITAYGGVGTGTATSVNSIDGFDTSKDSIPEMKYQYRTFAEALQAGWVDLLLLFLFSILFFVVAYVKFSKYDVR